MATIRPATFHDLEALVPLFDGYRMFYGQASDPSGASAFLRERITRRESVLLLAIHEDGHDSSQAVGFTQLYPLFSSVRMARLWLLNDLFVAPDARRMGIARSLLDAAAAFARHEGAAGLMLETNPDNSAARALYASAGWHEENNQWYALSLS